MHPRVITAAPDASGDGIFGTAADRLGPGPADVLLLTKSGLESRIDSIANGEAPRDFFYNFLGLLEQGVDVRIMNTSERYSGLAGNASHLAERLWARMTGISRRHHYLNTIRESWQDARVIVSFTDHFTLTLGTYFRDRIARPATVGFFHGLSDLPIHVTAAGRKVINGYIRRALEGLDIVGFFGPADMDEARRRFGISEERVALVRFGVDTDFWRPDSGRPSDGNGGKRNQLVSIGSDPNRDYETLIRAGLDCDVRIVTTLPVRVPPENRNITLTRGSFWGASLTDVELRSLYHSADAVVVPLRDVYQPTGYSVTLQAMACGVPVVLSNIKGLWTPDFMRDGENCLLVTPGDPRLLRSAIERLVCDHELSQRLARNGLRTIHAHFMLRHMYESMADAIDRAKAHHPRPART